MKDVAKEKLLRYIDRNLYDIEGYVNYKTLRERLGIKMVSLAQAIGKTQRALEKNPNSENIQAKLRRLAYILILLREMLGAGNEIAMWLRAPNPDYDGMSPLEIITQGKMDSIIRYLEDIQKGSLT